MFGKRRRRPADSFDVAMRDADGRVSAGRVVVRDGQGDLVHRQEWGDREAMETFLQEVRSRAALAGALVTSRTHVREGPSGEVTESWSFRVNTVVASGTIGRGVIGVSPRVMDDMNARSGTEVVVRHGGRTRSMTVRTSPDIEPFEVELSEEDIAGLGLSDGVDGQLEVQYGEPVHDRTFAEIREVFGGQGGPAPPRKVKVATKGVLRTDNDTPPYTVDSGLGFWRRRKRV